MAFPYHAEAQLSDAELHVIHRTISVLLSGQTYMDASPMRLVTGSRAEGFALSKGYTHETPDLDTMFLYGGDWCVHEPNMLGTHSINEHRLKTYPEMNTEGCAPCYCRVYVKGPDCLSSPREGLFCSAIRNDKFANRLISSLIGIGALLSFQYFPHNITIKCISLHLLMIPVILVFADFVDVLDSIVSLGPSIHRNGKIILSPKLFIEELSGKDCLDSDKQIQGPSMQYTSPISFRPISNYDLVPALICHEPFACMKQYLSRRRTNIWPSPYSLVQIAAMPGLLVPTGRKGSSNIDTDWWRYSFSVQEIYLSQEMPGWVKAGYRAFKYTLKHLSHVLRVSVQYTDEEVIYQDASVKQLIDRMTSAHTKYKADLELVDWKLREDRAKEHESKFCSYHMKTILLWSLEDLETWQQRCPFRLMLRLLHNLEGHLVSGILPHYFNTDCNLFANVPGSELTLIRACVVEILRDPIAAMSHTAVIPINPRLFTDFKISRQKQMIIRKRKLYNVAYYFSQVVLLLTVHYIVRLSYIHFSRA